MKRDLIMSIRRITSFGKVNPEHIAAMRNEVMRLKGLYGDAFPRRKLEKFVQDSFSTVLTDKIYKRVIKSTETDRGPLRKVRGCPVARAA